MIKFTQRIDQGYMYPSGYGRAWIDYPSRQDVVMPIPFNFIVGMARNAYFFLMKGAAPSVLDRYMRDQTARAYQRGFSEGACQKNPPQQGRSHE